MTVKGNSNIYFYARLIDKKVIVTCVVYFFITCLISEILKDKKDKDTSTHRPSWIFINLMASQSG